MASALSHLLVAAALGKTYASKPLPPIFWKLSAICSILPDVDVIGFPLGVEYGDVLGHRGLTHSLFFALLLSCFIAWLASKDDFTQGSSSFARIAAVVLSKKWWQLVLYFFCVTASHGFLDAMTNGGLGVAFFSPFDTTRYFLPWRPVEVSPIGIGLFFTAHGLAVIRSEILWIWVPSAALIVALWFRQKLAQSFQSHRLWK